MVAPAIPLIAAGLRYGPKVAKGIGALGKSSKGKEMLALGSGVGLARAMSNDEPSPADGMADAQGALMAKDASLGMPGLNIKGTPDNPALTGFGSNMAASAAGLVAGYKQNGFAGAIQGLGAASFGKLAFNNIQNDGGGLRSGLYSGLAAAFATGLKEGGPSPMQAFIGAAGIGMATNKFHDFLEDNGKSVQADIVAGAAIGGVADYVTDGELKYGALAGGASGAAYGYFLNDSQPGEPSQAQVSEAIEEVKRNKLEAAMQSGSGQQTESSNRVAQIVASQEENQVASPQAQEEQMQA